MEGSQRDLFIDNIYIQLRSLPVSPSRNRLQGLRVTGVRFYCVPLVRYR